MARARHVRTKGVSARLAQYLAKHPGEVVRVEDMASELNLRRDQVSQGMWNLRDRKPEFGLIEVIETGRQWKYSPNGEVNLEVPDVPVEEVVKHHRPVVQGPVFDFFTQHPNEAVTIEQIKAATNLDNVQVQRAISNLRMKKEVMIHIIVAGRVWRYVPGEPERPPEPEPEPPTRGLFEQIGAADDGTPIVRGEDDKLYALKPVRLSF